MPILTAVSSSVHQFHRLLRCINISTKAQVQISPDGLRFSVEDARVIQGVAFLEKTLFTSYRFDQPARTLEDNASQANFDPDMPIFQISLSALLETLSIFGATDTNRERLARDFYTSGITNARNGAVSAAFDTRTLGMAGVCRIGYRSLGDSLNITLEEGNVTTTCQLTTYDPETFEDIPFDRDSLTLKIIMRASLLFDAVQELSSTGPDRLTLICSPSHAAAFRLSASGDLGSASIDFTNEPQLLETFQCHRRDVNVYKFSMFKSASKAMAMASKVSIRIDDQGVLSLQFMVELAELEGKVSFIDFRFVPYVAEDEDASSDESSSPSNSDGE